MELESDDTTCERTNSMDITQQVFEACRDNNLSALKRCLNGKSQEEIETLVSAKTNGSTPLVVSTRNGHIDIVHYLIYKCNADVEQTSSVIFDDEMIEGAPPIWCATAARNLKIIKLLIKYGANINSTTKTNSTALRAACFDGQYEIVKYLVEHGADIEIANRHGHTCLMIACYKGHYKVAAYLVSQNAIINRRSLKGNTALHDCAESGSLEILKLLVANGATMEVDSYGMTPLLAASVTGHYQIVEHLISLTTVTRDDRIAALELLGATYVDKKRDMINAVSLWRRALEERYNHHPLIPKPTNTVPVPAFDNAREVNDIRTLEDIVVDPDAMRMQALIIRERILGPAHPDTSYYIRFRGAVYADAGRFDRCIELWTYALTMQQNILGPLSPLTQSSLLAFAELFSFMLGEAGRPVTRGRVVPPIDAQDILQIFNRAVTEVAQGQKMFDAMPENEYDSVTMSKAIASALHLGCLLAKLLSEDVCTDSVRDEVLAVLSKLIKLKVRLRSGQSVLHLACWKSAALIGKYPACLFPSPALVKYLILAGADVNAKDADGNTPLHLVTQSMPCQPELPAILLENGCHIDTKNLKGETFESLLSDTKVTKRINPLKFTKLSCLAARIIKEHNIQYVGEVPVSLHKFIELH